MARAECRHRRSRRCYWGRLAGAGRHFNDLLLESVESGRRVTERTLVITSGFTSSKGESLFPRGIPVGEVTKVDFDELETYQRVHVRPFADLRRVDVVQVLTRRGVAQQAAALPESGG